MSRSTPARTGRTPSEFARIYGSRARVRWVKAQSCVAASSFCAGEIAGHHIVTGGTGRKADADKIVPLCAFHHDLLHRKGRRWFEGYAAVDLPALAAETQAKWLAFAGAAA